MGQMAQIKQDICELDLQRRAEKEAGLKEKIRGIFTSRLIFIKFKELRFSDLQGNTVVRIQIESLKGNDEVFW